MLIVFLFLALVLSIWLTIKPNNLRKFFLEFWKNMIKPPFLQKGSYKISPVHLSICLSVSLLHIFLKIYPVDNLDFLDEDFLPYIFCQILENFNCCLDNWVNKTNLDQKRNIWHYLTILFVL